MPDDRRLATIDLVAQAGAAAESHDVARDALEIIVALTRYWPDNPIPPNDRRLRHLEISSSEWEQLDETESL